MLKTHRREVVVVFLDLRGFTVFTDSSEPEEVMRVLAEYHRVMGQLIMTHGFSASEPRRPIGPAQRGDEPSPGLPLG